MRIRSRDVATDDVGKVAWAMAQGGRVRLTQAKVGDGAYRYIATACEAEPVRELVVAQPVKSKAALASTKVRSPGSL
jgi:hypothetical protein